MSGVGQCRSGCLELRRGYVAPHSPAFSSSCVVLTECPPRIRQINHVFQITISHLSTLLAARTALVHARTHSPGDASSGLMLKTLTKHVGALIKHLRVRWSFPLGPTWATSTSLTLSSIIVAGVSEAGRRESEGVCDHSWSERGCASAVGEAQGGAWRAVPSRRSVPARVDSVFPYAPANMHPSLRPS